MRVHPEKFAPVGRSYLYCTRVSLHYTSIHEAVKNHKWFLIFTLSFQ